MGNPDVVLVKDLINTDEPSWNNSILNTHFLSIDKDQIECIPLINLANDDEIIWHFNQDGNYTVRSGYQAIQNWKITTISEPSNSNIETNLWKKLWTIHTIPRHKMILWRVLNNTLPLRSELGKRGILCNPLCPRCNSKIESMEHVFMTCPKITRIWFGSQLNLRITDQPISNFQD